MRLFRDRGLASGSLLVSLQFFASLGLFVLAPQYLQVVRDYSPLQAAAALLVIPVGVGAGTALAPPLLARVGARLPGSVGLAAMAVGFAALALALGDVDATSALVRWWLPAAGLVVFGFGFGLAITPGTVLIIDGLPEDRRSVASAVNDITREVGGVLGIAVLSSVLISVYRDDIDDRPGRAAAAGAGARAGRRRGGPRGRRRSGAGRRGPGRGGAGGVRGRPGRGALGGRGRARGGRRRVRRAGPRPVVGRPRGPVGARPWTRPDRDGSLTS